MFLLYSAVVWSSIAVLAAVTMTMHFLPKDALPEYVIRPHFAVNRCFIIGEYCERDLPFMCVLDNLQILLLKQD